MQLDAMPSYPTDLPLLDPIANIIINHMKVYLFTLAVNALSICIFTGCMVSTKLLVVLSDVGLLWCYLHRPIWKCKLQVTYKNGDDAAKRDKHRGQQHVCSASVATMNHEWPAPAILACRIDVITYKEYQQHSNKGNLY